MEQLIISLILIAVFFGLFKFVARALAWIVLLFIVIPAIAGMQFDVDWRRVMDRVLFMIGAEAKVELSEDIRATLTYNPSKCGSSQPLRFDVINDSGRDIAYIAYRLKVRPQDRSTEQAFREGTSDYIIKSGASNRFCVAIPDDFSKGDIYRADLQRVEYMSR